MPKTGAYLVPMDGLLAELSPIEVKTKELSQTLQDSPLETQLLSFADVSIERETEHLKEILDALERT